MKALYKAAAAAALAFAASAAEATSITYVGTDSLSSVPGGPSPGTIDANFSITTDGALGVLAESDITGYQISLTSTGGQSALIASTDAGAALTFYEVYSPPGGETTADHLGDDGALTATATGLFYNFAVPHETVGYVEFSNSNGTLEFCYVACEGTGVDAGISGFEGVFTSQGGNQLIATASVSAAPEPQGWTLMIIGAAAVGAALRRRQAICPAPTP